jgi:hypothetical protein
MGLKPTTLRIMWMFVEASNPNSILQLSDKEIIKQILQQVERVLPLSADDSRILSKYIGSRTPLIRDLAYGKIN